MVSACTSVILLFVFLILVAAPLCNASAKEIPDEHSDAQTCLDTAHKMKIIPEMTKKDFMDMVSDELDPSFLYPALEIGPFVSPTIFGPNAQFFDVVNKDGILEKAAKSVVYGSYDIDLVPNIDYVSPTGDLGIIPPGLFKAVFSSHCIEHQVDLVSHLQAISNLLAKEINGVVVLIIPDKRFSSDQPRRISTLRDVLATHWSAVPLGVHPLHAWLEDQCDTSTNHASDHWQGIHTPRRKDSDAFCYQRAHDAYIAANGSYLDLHRWTFTPCAFANIMSGLREMNLIDLHISMLSTTAPNNLEFYAILKKIVQ